MSGGWVWKFVGFDKKHLRVSHDDGCHVCVTNEYPPQGICIYLPLGT